MLSATASADAYIYIQFDDTRTKRAYKQLVRDWEGCTLCPCCLTRTRLVHYRGYLPCDVLFVGEAPGDSEDTSGYPFVGPAGELFDALRRDAWVASRVSTYASNTRFLRWGIVNIVACRPKTPKTPYSSGELRVPTAEEAEACRPRLLEIIRLANPRLIVVLGQIAARHLPNVPPARNKAELATLPKPRPVPKPKHFEAPVLQLVHPSAILRAEDRRKPTMEKRFVLTLAGALQDLRQNH